MIDLPENYFGVAARIATMDAQLGLVHDRADADDVLERAAGRFLAGALYADDAVPTGRYHRYSQEYARFVYVRRPAPAAAVARFEWFRRGDRAAGVWLVRPGPLRFALPITTGPRAGLADYLPAPHGLPGFAAPVEQTVPALVPHLELADGRVMVAGDGADEIEPGPDGRGLRATWRRLAVVAGPPAQPVPTGLASRVSWLVEGDSLVRSET